MIFITILIVVVSILLGLIVLIQNPKGGGLGSGFGNVNQIGGVQRTTDFLEKATWGLAIALVVLCMASAGLSSTAGSALDSEIGPGDAELYQAPPPAPVDGGAEAAPTE